MTLSAALLSRFVVTDTDDPAGQDRHDIETSLSTVLVRQTSVVDLVSGFNALTPPTGARWVIIEPLTGAVTWTLKGVTGDTGVAMSSGALPSAPISMPIRPGVIGITLASGSGTARVTWL